jgi:hypothetical protein
MRFRETVRLAAPLLVGGLLHTGPAASAQAPAAYDWLPRGKLSNAALALLGETHLPADAPSATDRRLSGLPVDPASDHVGSNIRMGDDPAPLPEGRRAQAEPHLARSFRDPGLLLATFQEGRFSDGGAWSCGYGVSRDGGRTWTRELIPGLVGDDGEGPYDRASDPVAAVGLDDLLLLNTLGLWGGDPAAWLTGILVNRSTDMGASFGDPIVVAESSSSRLFLDKNWMAVNSFAGTPTAGRVVVTLTRFNLSVVTGATNPIAISVSDDGGLTWSDLQIVTSNNVQGSQPVFLPDGSLLLGYWNFDGSTVESIWSADGGESFGEPTVVAEVTPYNDRVARSAAFLPSMASDRTVGVVHAAWQATHEGVPRIMVTRSRDRGQHWSPAVPVNDTPAGQGVFNPAIAVSPDGLHVTVIFYDKRHDDGSGNWVDLYLAESFDGGGTWEPNTRVTTESSDLRRAPLTSGRRMVGDYQGIAPALNLEVPAVAAWVDARGETPDPYSATIARRHPATFPAWQGLVFADPAAAEALPDADFEADGLPNLLEYLTGRSPQHVDAEPLQAGSAAASWWVEVQAVVGDVEPVWLAGDDLLSWAPANPVRQPEPGAEPAWKRWGIRLPPSPAGRHFLRMGAATSQNSEDEEDGIY